MDTVAYKDEEFTILKDFHDAFDRYSPEEIQAILSLIPQCSKRSMDAEEAGLFSLRFHGKITAAQDAEEKEFIEKHLKGLPVTTIHSFLSLLDKFPHLVTDPRCAIFIRGALFKSGVLSQATRISSTH